MGIRTLCAIAVKPEANEPPELNNLVGTGSWVAIGRGLEPVVIVHPPFSEALAAELIGVDRLIVYVTSWAGATPSVVRRSATEITVRHPQNVDFGPAGPPKPVRFQPIVALSLNKPTRAQPDPPLRSARELLAHLADPHNGPATRSDDGHDNNWLCKILGKCD